MGKRIIKVKILSDGSFKLDNSQNDDEQRILDEIAALSKLANGNEKGFIIEKHVHGAHAHTHIHTDDHQHIGG